MVNLDKWEEIDYGKIKRNDKIRCITVQGTVTSDTRGVVDWYDSRGVRNDKGITFLSDPSLFKPIVGGHRTIYRRKAKVKPFVFPTNSLAIIKAERIGYDGTFANFVKTGCIGSGWVHQSGNRYTQDEMTKWFHNFEVIFAGVDE